MPDPSTLLPETFRMRLRITLLLCLLLPLTGCGAWQALKNGSQQVVSAVFYPKLTTLKLDFTAREAINPDERGHALSVVVRVYQLRDGKAFARASYEQLLSQDRETLGDEMLARHDLLLRPGASTSLNAAVEPDTSQIAVVALLRQPVPPAIWRVSMSVKELDNQKAARLELLDNQILITWLPHPPDPPAAPQPQTPATPPAQKTIAPAAASAPAVPARSGK
ncbi:type VI secretion system lipoprotein TssJ [Aquitalea sp. LB_tupeE]|uniref:type VI secretion system lipoprotein TssJ n=1 Tax=Aquitalea sp. LB_tupeE TaxID=2748078 RepID=UPI0015B94FFF|nr:type VI secretion system lipoprotein TssJ [Aquitalea sp. LB_tupeE]NWK78832.1 type VI secretion system lipoprotein TssJ [Aquitalea sp. LB_tupeE]